MDVQIDINKLTFSHYLALIDEKLALVQTKTNLDFIVNFIYEVENERKFFQKEKREDYLKIALKIREIIKNMILSGQLPDRNYLYLYVVFDNLEIELDDFFSKQASIINDNFYLMVDSEEKIISNDLIFLFDILNAKTKLGVEGYIKRCVSFDLDGISSNFSAFLEFVSNKFLAFISIDFIFDILADLYRGFSNFSDKSKRTLCNWTLHCVYNVPIYFNSKEWSKLYPIWRENLYTLIEEKNIDMVVYFQFFIYHFMGNLFKVQDEWKNFNKEINQPCSKFYLTTKKNLPEIKPNPSGKKRIALLKDRITNNSVFKLEFSLFKRLMNSKEFTDKYEVYIYSCNYFEKNFDDEGIIALFNSIGVKTVSPAKEFINKGYYNSHYEKALLLRETIISDEMDILISSMNGYGIGTFLYSTRTAPKQLFWSHGDYTYDIDGVDGRVIGYGLKDLTLAGFDFKSFAISLYRDFLVPSVAPKFISEVKNRFVGKTILGTICRFIKISDEFLEVLVEILKRNPNCVYLACGAGDEDLLSKKVKELGIEKQFIIEGFVDPHVHGYAMDIFLDTFPFYNGTSVGEYTTKSKVAIRMVDDANREILTTVYERFPACKDALKPILEKLNLDVDRVVDEDSFQKYIGESVGFCDSKESYIEFAQKIIKDREYRDLCGEFWGEFVKLDLENAAVDSIPSFIKAVDGD